MPEEISGYQTIIRVPAVAAPFMRLGINTTQTRVTEAKAITNHGMT